MNVNAVNSFSVNKNNTHKASGQSFGSIMRVKVIHNGVVSTDKQIMKSAIIELSEKLFKPAQKGTLEDTMQSGFEKYDRDYVRPKGMGDKSQILRNIIKRNMLYLFTGGHAQQLDDMGRMIGPAKSAGLKESATTNTEEVNAARAEYFAKADALIKDNMPSRLRERINPKTFASEGQEIGLCIYTKDAIAPSKKQSIVDLQGIVFRKISESPPQITAHVRKPGELNLGS